MIKIGQRVYSILYGGRHGIVFGIHGEQRPDTVQKLGGGAVVMGGSASFDIVFDTGTLTNRLPESILHGVQWTIYEEIAPQDEIDGALEYCKQEDDRKNKAFEERKRQDGDERERIKKEYSFLIRLDQEPKTSHWALGAKNMKRELEMAYPGVKFSTKSESYSMGNSINVSWTDGPTSEEVKKISDKYQKCSFDGMQDLETYRDVVWPDVFGGAKYVSENRHYSAAAYTAAVERICKEWGVSVPEIKTDSYGSSWFDDWTRPEGSNFDLPSLVHQELYKTNFYTPPPAGTEIETGGNGNGHKASMALNQEKSGVEIRFPSKPEAAILEILKANGFRWSRPQSLWYAKQSEKTLRIAKEICE